MAIKLLQGVVMSGLSPVMRPALITAARIMKLHGADLVISNAVDGVHAPCSFHYYGYALNFCTQQLSPTDIQSILKQLSNELSDYNVTHNQPGSLPSHIHIESEKGFYRHVQKLNGE